MARPASSAAVSSAQQVPGTRRAAPPPASSRRSALDRLSLAEPPDGTPPGVKVPQVGTAPGGGRQAQGRAHGGR